MCLEERRSTGRNGIALWSKGLLMVALLAMATGGCSKAEDKQGDPDTGREEAKAGGATQAGSPAPPPPKPEATPGAATAAETPTSVSAPEVDSDAPTVDALNPNLVSAALVHAHPSELSEDVLLRSGDLKITQKEIDAEIGAAPEAVREQLRKNAIFLLEQMATRQLLRQEARAALAEEGRDVDELSEQGLLQAYFEKLTADVEVSDAEVSEFYEENQDMVGGQPLEAVKGAIVSFLRQQRQQELVDNHIRNLGRRMKIQVDADWLKMQAELAKDNPVDKARASGKPTFVNFGAQGCVPCDMMEPMREEIREEYEGTLNVVFVHVGEERILASRYGVQGIPLLIFYDADGKEVHRHTGYMEREKLEEQLADLGVK